MKTAEVGGHGWGNQELEYHTNRIDNAYQSQGSLVIKAMKERYTGADNVTRDYTSARLTTKSKFTAKHGRFEARIRIPYGQSLWPSSRKPCWSITCASISQRRHRPSRLSKGLLRSPGVYAWEGGKGFVSRSPINGAFMVPLAFSPRRKEAVSKLGVPAPKARNVTAWAIGPG
ncbi:MAG TPA: glycoside hydrolase family 16 protein [Pyrinomonadaceae bacterium]|nr:glycoside hydrolase family 16 protein [Pyrinomonadaceae bacterium]